jgi:ATP-binding cassette subfamily B protein
MIDLGFSAVGGGRVPAHVDAVFLALLAAAAVLAAGTAARFYAVSWLGERVTADVRAAVYRHVLVQSPQFFETTRAGAVLSRLTTDTTLVQTLVGSGISVALRSALLFAGGLAMMFLTSARLTALIAFLLVVVLAPMLVLGRRVRALSRDSQDRLADASALAGEVLNAMPVVQACTHERLEAVRFADAVERAFMTAMRRIRARAWLTALAILLVFAAIVFVLWLGAHAVMRGQMSGGQLVQFILYSAIVAGAVGALAETLGEAQRAAGAAERLLDLLAVNSPVVSPVDPIPLPPRGPRGAALALRNVEFRYPSRPELPAVADLSLEVAPGETVAVVGPSGAGKTTLFNLLLRFYDPQGGSIRLDGVEIRALALEELRGAIGIVPQDTVIFAADAFANIRYGREDASDDEVVAAARMAAAHDFLERLPQGYRTFLGERGVRLSGGQRQRIAIARALLRNPALLLLDEATSALDAESERLVQDALDAAMAGRTTLVIAHRLATVQKADRIVVLEGGRLAETGTHAALVAQGGLYAKLAALQFHA